MPKNGILDHAMPEYVAYVVPRQETKQIKRQLENLGYLNKSIKIRPCEQASNCYPSNIVPTTIRVSHVSASSGDGEENTASNELRGVPEELRILQYTRLQISVEGEYKPNDIVFKRALRTNLLQLPSELISPLNGSVDGLVQDVKAHYYTYPPMLLLPKSFSKDKTWKILFQALYDDQKWHKKFFESLARCMNVTHIAVDSPIPFALPNTEENLIRSPTNLQPLYGNFGPDLPVFPQHIPSTSDFKQAFWVSTQQNSITQIWAPRYTMFSAGNITEKARILKMESVHSAIAQGVEGQQGCTAVDLFSGIGYFAFSYVKAGVTKVLCWDLNPWSVEGLRRGAEANRWSCQIVEPQGQGCWPDCQYQEGPKLDMTTKFMAFNESNRNASTRIEKLRPHLPPIRHVNCGMLPSAAESWKTAVRIMDPICGGWLHLHETVPERETYQRAHQVLGVIQDFCESMQDCDRDQAPELVALEHIEKVKSMSPRILHIVMDICMRPRQAQRPLETI